MVEQTDSQTIKLSDIEKELQTSFFKLVEARETMKKAYEGEGLTVYIHFEDTRASVITEVHPIPDLLP